MAVGADRSQRTHPGEVSPDARWLLATLCTDGQQLLTPIDPKLEPPELAPCRGDQLEHAAAVRQLNRLRAGSGIADGYIGQSHGFPSLSGVCTPIYPQAWGYRDGRFACIPQSYPNGWRLGVEASER